MDKAATLLGLSISTLLSLTILSKPSSSQSVIGVNYGELSDKLPPPAITARLLRSTTISKLRLYRTIPAIINSLAGSNISIVIGTSNGDIASLATDPAAAANWVDANVASFYPASAISVISVGNQVLLYGDANLTSQILPAMQNLHSALAARSLDGKIKISTVYPMSVLQRYDPPSAGSFDPAHADTLWGILGFLNQTGGPFMINLYPFFSYQGDPRPETLAFCLFQPNAGRVDGNTKIKYRNMFDTQVDAVRSAMNAMGFKNVEIVVAETGWPYNGDKNVVGASVENAKAYNGNLVAHLKSMVGTPLIPWKSVDTFIFSLYDEDLKPGTASDRSFGLYKTDITMNYDVGLAKDSETDAGSPTTGKVRPTASWCVPKPGVSDEQLRANLDYACSQPEVNCEPIKPGGVCCQPNTLAAHAGYAMNMLYHSYGEDPWTCDFRQTATITSQNPSHAGCVYPGN